MKRNHDKWSKAWETFGVMNHVSGWEAEETPCSQRGTPSAVMRILFCEHSCLILLAN